MSVAHSIANGKPAQVHKGLRLRQQDFLPCQNRLAGERLSSPVGHHRPRVVRDTVNGQKPRIMRRELILDSWISKSDNQFHVPDPLQIPRRLPGYALRQPPSGSYFLAESAAGAASLPFLATSGSVAAATASTGASSFTMVT